MSDERSEYRGDVWYEEWLRGLPEGSISDDRIDDGFYSGVSVESLVSREAQRQHESHMERLRQEQEQYEYEQQFQQEEFKAEENE